MKSFGYGDFLVGVGMVLVIEGLLFTAIPNWMRNAMKSAMASPDTMLRIVGFGSAVAGLILIWFVRR